MANNTITVDLPKKVASAGGSSFVPSSGGGGQFMKVQLLPGSRPLYGDQAAKSKSLYNIVHNINKRSSKNWRHTITNDQQGADSQYAFVVNDGYSIAMMGTNQYSDKGAGNHSSWDYNGATLHSPMQWVSINGDVLRQIMIGNISKDDIPSGWTGYDLREHMAEGKTGMQIVGIYMGYTNMFLTANGILWANGYNGHGQVGDQATSNRASLRVVGWSYSHPGASANHYERLYWNTVTDKPRKIIQFTSSGEQSDSALSFHALGDDGSLWGWGYNGYGQVGVNNSTSSNAYTYSPKKCARGPKSGESGVQYVEDAVYVKETNGQYGTCWYIDEDGLVWAAGRNSYYQMQYAHGNNQTYFVPCGHNGSGTTNVGKKCIKIAASANGDVCHSIYLYEDGTVSTGGYSGYGQIMSGSTAGTNNHTALDSHFGPSGSKGLAKDVWATGGSYGQIYVRTEDNKLWGAGYSGYGQLGSGRSSGTYNGVYEVLFDWASSWNGKQLFSAKRYCVDIRSGGWGSTNYLVALLNDGTVWVTGRNNQWQRYRQGSNYYYWTTPHLPYEKHGKVVQTWCGDSGSDAGTIYYLFEDGALYHTGYYHSWDSNSWYVNDNPNMINGQLGGIA